MGGPTSPDRKIFPKNFFSGGYFGYTSLCTPLVKCLDCFWTFIQTES